MPRVRMLTSLVNARHAFADGEVVDASPDEAQAWIRAGICELVTTEAATPERGLRSEERRGPGRPRKYPRG